MPTTRVRARTADVLRGLAAAGLLLAAAPAQAQFARAEGDYRSAQLQVRLVLLDREVGTAAASATLTQGACSASLAGIGQIRKRTLELTPYVKQPGGDSCRLVLAFDEGWRRVSATAQGDCSAYGGASCEWAGQSATKAAD
jgi:hypothetical protein